MTLIIGELEGNYQQKSTAQNKSEINSESPFIFFKLRWAGENQAPGRLHNRRDNLR